MPIPGTRTARIRSWRRSAKRFRKKFNEEPETYAAHAYDGMNMLIWGIQVAGLNRAKIRDVLAYRTQPWPGVTGDIPFSSCLDDAGEVFLTKYEGGKWKYFSREDLGLPKAAQTVQVQQVQASASSGRRSPETGPCGIENPRRLSASHLGEQATNGPQGRSRSSPLAGESLRLDERMAA